MKKSRLKLEKQNFVLPLKTLKEKRKILQVVSKFSSDFGTLEENYKKINQVLYNIE